MNSKIEKTWTSLSPWILIALASIVIIVVTIKINSSRVYDEEKSLLNQNWFISLLVIVNNLLVTINTIYFIAESLTASKRRDNDFISIPDKLLDAIFTVTFIVFNSVTLLISFGTALIYWLKVEELLKVRWDQLFQLSEIAALMMFAFFIVADWAILKQFEIAINSSTAKKKYLVTQKAESEQITTQDNKILKLESNKKFTRNAIYLIDIAGFVGILLIYFISHVLQTVQEKNFVEGFAVGAIAFHIFFTQLNFAILQKME